ncbi:MAG: hypothetical protein IKS48_04585 [Eubacterium sp.]|nr:hypothetical protein [Eubacterium sp.]
MEVKERVIDLRQYFLFVWENAIVFVLVVLAFALGMAGFSYNKQKKEMNSVAEERINLSAIISQNHDAFYGISSKGKFTDADQPDNTFNSSARLFVDFDYSSIENNSNLDFTQMTTKVQQDAMLLLVSDTALTKVMNDLKLNEYDDMKNLTTDDLKWMINRNFLGVNIFQIVVTDVDPDRAHLIADAVVKEFFESAKSFKTISNVEIIDNASIPQLGIENKITSGVVDKKKLLKYAIVGCAGGVILMALTMLLIYIFKDAVRNAIDLAFADINLFGMVSRKELKKKESYRRIAYNIAISDNSKVLVVVPTDSKSEDAAFISGVEEVLNSTGKTVGVISGEDAGAESILKNIEKEKQSKDIVIVSVRNIRDYADATLAAVNADKVMLLATFGKTRMKDLIYAKSELDKTGTPILGAVLNQARYL